MDPHEREELLAALTAGRAAFLEAVGGLSEEAARQHPRPEGWSVMDCVEHVAIAEYHLLNSVCQAQDVAGAPFPREREAQIRAVAADRSRKIPAPEAARPAGRFATLRDAVDAFLAARARTLDYAASCDGDLRLRIAKHPILGEANCYEMLLIISGHSYRHAGQIEEIRSQLTG